MSCEDFLQVWDPFLWLTQRTMTLRPRVRDTVRTHAPSATRPMECILEDDYLAAVIGASS